MGAFVDAAQAQAQDFGGVWLGGIEVGAAFAAEALGALVAAGGGFDVVLGLSCHVDIFNGSGGNGSVGGT